MSLPPEELFRRAGGGEAESDNGALVRKLGRGSVLVVGDVMLDRYVYGEVDRISPEAPVPVVMVAREVAMPGGAGNVVRNLTALGAAAAFVSVVGDDQPGSDITALIGGQPGVEPWLLVEGGRTTTVKTRYFAQGQQLLRADWEETGPIQPKLAERLLRIARDAMVATSVTVISDYGKGVLAGGVPERLIAAARETSRPTIVDPKRGDYRRFAGADVITPNRRELAEATGMDASSDREIVAAAEALRRQHDIGAVVVTRAEAGITLVDAGGAQHFPAAETPVVDVSGAGDAVVATLAAALAGGLGLAEAVRLANVVAGLVVGKIGTAVVQPGELLAALTPEGGALRKIVGRQAALEQVARWRRKGLRLALTSGAFDPLYPAQVLALDEARAGCDRLIVLLDTDPSRQRPRRPNLLPQSEATRAAALANLAAVDMVSALDREPLIELAGALRPDLLVTGPDFGFDESATAELVRATGARTLIIEPPGPVATVTRLMG